MMSETVKPRANLAIKTATTYAPSPKKSMFPRARYPQ
jgi:hypothetical protein